METTNAALGKDRDSVAHELLEYKSRAQVCEEDRVRAVREESAALAQVEHLFREMEKREEEHRASESLLRQQIDKLVTGCR